jgi:hypothetical protein
MNLSHTLNLKTTYAVTTLIAALQKNKAAHIEEYNKACAAYDKKKSEKLVKLNEAVLSESANFTSDMNKVKVAYNSLTTLIKPVDASKMYDEYISILSFSTATDIELSTQDANAIINDSWEWAQTAKLSNSTYLSAGSF